MADWNNRRFRNFPKSRNRKKCLICYLSPNLWCRSIESAPISWLLSKKNGEHGNLSPFWYFDKELSDRVSQGWCFELDAVVTSRTEFYSSMSHAVGGRATSPRSPTPLGRNLGQSQPFANSYESPGVTTNERQLPIDHQRRDDDTYNQGPITQPPSCSDNRTAGITFCNNCDNPIV